LVSLSIVEKRGKLIKHLEKISSENAKVLIFIGYVLLFIPPKSGTRADSFSLPSEPSVSLMTSRSTFDKMDGQHSPFTVTSNNKNVIGFLESSSLVDHLSW